MDKVEQARDALDKELESVHRDAGIMFGEDLFEAFKSRGWFTLETFGVLGTSLFTTQAPAYKKSHFVFSSWSIGNLEFKVGQASK